MTIYIKHMIIFTYIYIYIHTYIYYDIIKLSLMIMIILHHVKSIPKGPPGGHCRSRWILKTHHMASIEKDGAEINQKNHRSNRNVGFPRDPQSYGCYSCCWHFCCFCCCWGCCFCMRFCCCSRWWAGFSVSLHFAHH